MSDLKPCPFCGDRADIPAAFLSPEGQLIQHDPTCDPDQFRGWSPLYHGVRVADVPSVVEMTDAAEGVAPTRHIARLCAEVIHSLLIQRQGGRV